MLKILFFILLSFSSLAQIGDSQIEYLKDSQGRIDIQKAVKSPSFVAIKNKVPSLGIYPGPVWSRLNVANKHRNRQTFYAQILLPYMDTVQYFLVKNKILVGQSEKMGWWSNIDYKHFNSPNHLFSFSLNPKESVWVYARTVKTHGTVRLPLKIDREEEFLNEIYIKNTFFGWFLGMAFLIVLLNIFMFLLLKERVYWLYTVYVTCQILTFMLREGFHVQAFNRGVGPISGLNFYYFGLISMAISNLVFIHALLNAKKLQPKTINFSFRFLFYFGLSLAILQCLPNGWGLVKSKAYTMALTFSYLASLGLAFVMVLYAIFKNKERMSAIIYSISGVPLLGLGAVQILANMRVFHVNTAYRGVLIILAIAFEMIVLCFWLAHRFKQFADDRARLIKEKSKQQQIALETGLQLQYQERIRLAKELHDGIGIDISIIKMKLEALRLDLEPLGLAKKEFSETISNLDNVASDIRSFSHNLMPPDLEKNGIAIVLQSLVYNLQSLNSDIEIYFTSNVIDKLEKDLSQNLYFIAKELINNALKHSKATIIDVELMNIDNRTELLVSDNGLGYDYEQALKKGGLGLESIRSRVKLMEATLDIKDKPNSGVSHKIIVGK